MLAVGQLGLSYAHTQINLHVHVVLLVYFMHCMCTCICGIYILVKYDHILISLFLFPIGMLSSLHRRCLSSVRMPVEFFSISYPAGKALNIHVHVHVYGYCFC